MAERSAEGEKGSSDSVHVLQDEWTLWFDQGQKTSGSWGNDMKQVYTMATAEQVGSLIEVLKPPSELQNGTNYRFFKKDIIPSWEHEANARGGRWVLLLPPQMKAELRDMWLRVLLALVGDQFTDGDDVNGFCVSRRKNGDRLELWIRHAGDGAFVIGKEFAKYLDLQALEPPDMKQSFTMTFKNNSVDIGLYSLEIHVNGEVTEKTL